MSSVVASACAAFLLVAAALKLADRTGTEIAFTTYGISGRAARFLGCFVPITEVLLAAGLLAGLRVAAWVAAPLFVVFACAQAGALATGRGGQPCGCLGGGGRLSGVSLLRTAALAGAAGWVAGADPVAPPLDRAALAALAGTVAVAGFLLVQRRRPDGALDVAGEGPVIGEITALTEWLPASDGRLRLAVFTSAGCRLCRTLGSAMQRIDAEGRVVLRGYEAERDREAWTAAGVPGAPYAVVVAADGIVVAKGTVNTEQQLRGVVADAHARAGIPLIKVTGAASRRAFIGRSVAAAGAVAAGPAVSALVAPGEAQAHHYCGHTYTTDSCPHPTGLPRVDTAGKPLRAQDGHRVDDLGRPIDDAGLPLDDGGRPLIDPDGRRLPPAPRTSVCKAVQQRYGFRTRIDGSWYRCCDGHVRRLVDCCSDHDHRINGDKALVGYCYRGRKVFCVLYHQTRVKC